MPEDWLSSMRGEILKKLGVTPLSDESFEILVATLKSLLRYSDDIRSLVHWDAPVLPMLTRLEAEEVKFLESEVEGVRISLKECRLKVQKLIPRDLRRSLSVYYTVDMGSDLMASLSSRLLSEREEVVIADPFLGSGSTLVPAIGRIGERKVKCVWGIEALPLPALVAYASLLDSLGGRRDSVKVMVGDSFKLVPKLIHGKFAKADAVLTNPPFTRWRNLGKGYREFLISLARELGYGEYLTRGEVGLQAFSLFLCDYILNEKGLLISVLPASTFYTIYGRGIKRLMRERYGIHALISSKSRASFSEDSGFKELIFAATKGQFYIRTAFIEVDERFNDSLITDNVLVDLHNAPRFLDLNWLAFFNRKLSGMLTEAIEKGLREGKLRYGVDLLRGKIVRGIEIYGPDFFFLPNRFWRVVEESDDSVLVKRGDEELVISKDFLVRVLRKPSLYANRIKIEADSFMLSIPPLGISELPDELRRYVEWGSESGAAGPALRSKGPRWYSHVWRQVSVKKPYGRVFLPDKVDISFRNRSVFANYSEEETTASKDFYIIRSGSETVDKLLVGWFNSTIFISILILLGRRISETWTRFLEDDYLELPIPDFSFTGSTGLKVVERVERLLKLKLPPIRDQIGSEERYELDLALAEFIGLRDPEEFIENLHECIRGEQL
ncbi:MAG: restriction endonuclease subunit M [Candidatus Korarchaeum sp.]